MRNQEPGFSKDIVDPNLVPQKSLYTGARIPVVGMGTFGSDRYSAEEVAAAVKGGAEIGYRFFDCASVYGNEHLIGKVFRELIETGIRREELFIASKLWNDMHGKGDVLLSCAKTLKDLNLDYLDLFFVHWPFPNFHPKGADPGYRDPNSKPYIHEAYMETWYQMERLVSSGLVRHIGTSNMTIPKLKLLLRDASIKPAANEMELHPSFQQPELFGYCADNGIQPIGYCPVGSPARPERDRTPDDVVDIEDPVIVKIAEAHNVHPAVICIKWAVQNGQIPIPFSIHRDKYASNLKTVINGLLSNEEMKEIKGVNKNCRLIKGQVFLWKEGQTWEDLWDITGEITPA